MTGKAIQVGLPKYRIPPVVEVAASFRFSAVEKFGAVHVSEFWDRIGRDDYPTYRELAPLAEPTVLQSEPMVSFEVMDRPPLRRQWFASPDDSEIVQLQNGLLAFSWRKLENSETQYPHFHRVIDKFYIHQEALKKTFELAEIPAPQVTYLELAYVNFVQLDEDLSNEEYYKKIGSIFPILETNGAFSNAPEMFNLFYAFNSGKNATGRIQFSSAQNIQTGKRGLQLKLSVFGNPLDESSELIKDWFDSGHIWIVTTFDNLVSDKMKLAWEKYDG